MKMTILISTGIFLMAPFCFAGGSSSAGAGQPQRDIPMEILNHSVVVSLEKLMNEKYSNQCVVPSTEKDIHWMCLGALPPVTQPTIYPNSCGFVMTIVCPGETATVFGQTVSYSLLSPAGQRNTVTPTETHITIETVQFK